VRQLQRQQQPHETDDDAQRLHARQESLERLGARVQAAQAAQLQPPLHQRPCLYLQQPGLP
jgi:hypothetical protein